MLPTAHLHRLSRYLELDPANQRYGDFNHDRLLAYLDGATDPRHNLVRQLGSIMTQAKVDWDYGVEGGWYRAPLGRWEQSLSALYWRPALLSCLFAVRFSKIYRQASGTGPYTALSRVHLSGLRLWRCLVYRALDLYDDREYMDRLRILIEGNVPLEYFDQPDMEISSAAHDLLCRVDKATMLVGTSQADEGRAADICRGAFISLFKDLRRLSRPFFVSARRLSQGFDRCLVYAHNFNQILATYEAVVRNLTCTRVPRLPDASEAKLTDPSQSRERRLDVG